MLPQMNDKFDAFIAPAREHRGGLLFLGAVLFLLLAYTEITFGLVALFSIGLSVTQNIPLAESMGTVSAHVSKPETPVAMIGVLLTFVAMLAAVWLTVGLFRGQSIGTLLGRGGVLRNFLLACMIVAPFQAIAFTLALGSGEAVPNLPLSNWVLWMLPALPLLLIQVSAEELVFRGYLLQEFATRFQNRWIWLVLPSLVFGSLHFDPTRFGTNSLLIVAATTLFGVIAADVTVRTGNLGAAIGLHLMNNFLAMMLVSMDGTLNGLSLFVTRIHVSDHEAVRQLLLMDIAALLVIYGCYLLVMRWRERR
ncbi:CPBP family intramembrane glutamic endopeptidase [Neptunicoccus sediminis]|uniref:CPBP family intramembrane glutamic endopeptidase n=1 Tax=Neptunicoccus sediminis TaxID=1892596 RepID=UPI000845D53B|nr:CPBP family intramembrane glutamic endopeptidase [Neptunicoccus sediminis]